MMQLALIGLGTWGKHYIPTIESLADCRIKYVCAKTDKTLRSLKGDYIKTTNYKDLLACSDINGVIIATPALTHFPIARDFLNKGFNVLIEKPITTKLSEVETLQRIARQKKKVLMVGYIYFYNPAFVTLLRNIKKIGKIRHIQTSGFNWVATRRNVSTLWDWGSHDIGMCLKIMQQFPKKIHAQAYRVNKKEDIVLLTLYFTEAQAIINFGSLLSKRREVYVVGEKGSMLFDDTVEKKLTFFQNKGWQYSNDASEVKKTHLSYEEITPLAAEVKAFIHAIKKKKLLRNDMQLALDITKILISSEHQINRNN